MYSLRYGTVPVVRAVGGLVDTVRPYNPRNGQGNGFLFSNYQPRAFVDALRAALAAFPNRKIWTRLQKNGMRADFSGTGRLAVCQNVDGYGATRPADRHPRDRQRHKWHRKRSRRLLTRVSATT
jgi:glycogen synthase